MVAVSLPLPLALDAETLDVTFGAPKAAAEETADLEETEADEEPELVAEAEDDADAEAVAEK